MMRHLTRAVVFSVTVLVSYLVTGALEDLHPSETEHFRPLTATLLGMGIIVLIFVPVFAWTEKFTEAIVKAALRQSRSGAGKIIGALLFVIIVFVILLALFLDRWFERSLIDVM